MFADINGIKPIEDIIIYEDDHIILCDKPAGLAVEGRNIRTPDLMSMLRMRMKEMGGQPDRLWMIHRIDQPVRGLVLFAKTKKAAAFLSEQFSDGRAEKIYLAKVCIPAAGSDAAEDGAVSRIRRAAYEVTDADGRIADWQRGILEDYLLKEKGSNQTRVVKAGTPGAKLSRLSYSFPPRQELPVEGENDPEQEKTASRQEALVYIRIMTGRHHQIRAQLGNAGMPIVGDFKYGYREDPKGDAAGESKDNRGGKKSADRNRENRNRENRNRENRADR